MQLMNAFMAETSCNQLLIEYPLAVEFVAGLHSSEWTGNRGQKALLDFSIVTVFVPGEFFYDVAKDQEYLCPKVCFCVQRPF